MTQVRFNRKPFEGSFNNLVDGFFTELPAFIKNEFNQTERKGFVPVNVKETENSYQLEVIAPGFEKTDFNISVEQGMLTISAEKKNETKDDSVDDSKVKQVRKEYIYRSFKRSFTIDEKIDAAAIEAIYNNGVLTLNLPKKEVVKPAVTAITIK